MSQIALRAFDRLIETLAVAAGIYLVAIMVGIVFQASARTLGYSGSSHVFTFTEYGLLYITMAAAPWLARERGHVFIEILTSIVSPTVRDKLSRTVAFLCMLTCVILAWYAGEVTLKNFVRGDADMRSLDMPRWILMISMPICFSLMAVQFARFSFGSRLLHSGEAGVHE